MSSDSRGRSYSEDGFGALQMMSFPAVSIAGTAASITAIADTQRRIMQKIKVTGTGGLFLKTGGTAAGPTLLLQYSLAGTGAWTSFGSWASGTAADNTVATLSITETALTAGDVIRFAVAAGTAAATPVVHATVPFQEVFVGN